MINEQIIDSKSGAVYVCSGVVWKQGVKILYFIKDSSLPGLNKMQFTHEFYLKLISVNKLQRL